MIDVSSVPFAAWAAVALSAHLVFCWVLYRNLPGMLRAAVYPFVFVAPLGIAFLAADKGGGGRHALVLWLVAAVSGAVGCIGQKRRFAVGGASGGRLTNPEQVNAAWAIMIRILVPLVALIAFLHLKVQGWQ